MTIKPVYRVTDLLRRETHVQHQQLHDVLDLSLAFSTREHYLTLLKQYRVAVGPLEEGLKNFRVSRGDLTDGAIDWPERLSKLHWIQSDLHYLGCRDTEFSMPDSVKSFSAFVGRAYVLEGMMLGATQLFRALETGLRLNASTGGRFLWGYGQQTGKMWKAFKSWADECEIDADDATAEAQQTFLRFSGALSSGIHQ